MPAIVGLVPAEVVRSLSAFMEFCYIIRHSVLDETDLLEARQALDRHLHYRTVFEIDGVRPTGFSLPRAHSLEHYLWHVRGFAAPNGLCSSITESHHIKAVKDPYRRSNRFQPLGQMLLYNQRQDKLAAARNDFESRGMLAGSYLAEVANQLLNEDTPPLTLSPTQNILAGSEAATQGSTAAANGADNNDDDDDDGIVDQPRAYGGVFLACYPGMFQISIYLRYIY